MMLPASSSPSLARLPVVLSTDIGNEIDDQWALTHLLLNPRIHLLAVLSAHAPSLPSPSAQGTLRVLAASLRELAAHQPQPPIFAGADDPLSSQTAPHRSPAAMALLEIASGFTAAAPLTVVAIGAATDIASAILLDPSIVDRIRVVQMAFVDEHGGDEYNILNDPLAQQVLFHSAVPLTLGPASVCRAHLSVSFHQARSLLAHRGSIGAWLWHDFESWYFRHVKPLRVDDFSAPWIIWDEITTAFLLGFTETHIAPRPIMALDASFTGCNPHRSVTWITHVDSDALWQSLAADIDAAQQSA